MQPQRLVTPEDEFNNAAPAHRCAICGGTPPTPPPPYDDDLGGVEYMMMRGRWLR